MMRLRITRSRRVNEDYGAPAFELLEQRLEPFVAQVDAICVRKQRHAIQFQNIIDVGQLGERAVHIRERQRGETAKPVRAPLDQACREFVAASRQSARARIVSRMNARRRN
jgi:hypothetical protein